MKPFRPCTSKLRILRFFNCPQFLPVVPRRLRHSEDVPFEAEVVPLRKELKDAAKKRKQDARLNPSAKSSLDISNWELTVGIEIHAELNTSRKLFSDAFAPSAKDEEARPNSNVALFDLAYPGSQPHFQYATLLPALRAALALNCEIQRRSGWDRKHYFYQDQPNGYQITQYYGKMPFQSTPNHCV
jgi:aspartyl-tRNA(Asn)/glutamyl-tRNA(Gln) amidotransferase subunit B